MFTCFICWNERADEEKAHARAVNEGAVRGWICRQCVERAELAWVKKRIAAILKAGGSKANMKTLTGLMMLLAVVAALAAEKRQQFPATCPKCREEVQAAAVRMVTNKVERIGRDRVAHVTLTLACPFDGKRFATVHDFYLGPAGPAGPPMPK